MDILVAEKNGINTLDGKSGSGYADTDLIQLYANDGTPNGKIARSALMSCVKDSLGSLLNAGADQQTISKVPTLNGNTFGASTIATLASVLGGFGFAEIIPNSAVDTTYKTGLYKLENYNGKYGGLLVFNSSGWYWQVMYYNNGAMFRRNLNDGHPQDGWNQWQVVTSDMPDFYKNYGTLNALISALGEEGLGVDIRSTHMATVDVGELKAISAAQGTYSVTTEPVDVCVFNNAQLLAYYEGGKPVVHFRMRRNGEWIEKIL